MFLDREDAGRQLGRKLQEIPLRDPLVLAIPRGGVVTGAAIAREIHAELDVVLARKLRAPMQPELALGAIGEDGQAYVNREVVAITGVTDEYLQEERLRQWEEIEQRKRKFRAVRPAAPIQGRSIILTDDGIATGATMVAAIEVVRAQAPYEVIVAVPVASSERLRTLEVRCDRAICLETPADFWAVGQVYESFEQVSDDQVVQLLREFAPAGGVRKES